MPILAIATSKGGAGKTTLAACLAAHWTRSGRSVYCLDTDPNRNLVDWLADTDLVCSAVGEDELLTTVADLVARVDWIILDVAGTLDTTLLYAVSVADLVLIPAQCDRKDIIQAVNTRNTIIQAQDSVGRSISHRVILTRVNPRADVTRHTRDQLAPLDLPALSAVLPARTAYQQISYTKGLLINPEIRQDITAIAAAIDQIIGDQIEKITDEN